MTGFHSTESIQYFHAHIYYTKDTLEEARQMRQSVGKIFGIELGHLHERPVGPHPMWSCQLSVTKERFGEIIPWLAINRGNLDFFIHAVTGDDLIDHTQNTMWLGKSYELRLEMFK